MALIYVKRLARLSSVPPASSNRASPPRQPCRLPGQRGSTIKHNGYRLMVRRDGSRVRCFTKIGHDWAVRFPSIVEAAQRLKAASFLIDGGAVMTTESQALRSKRRGAD